MRLVVEWLGGRVVRWFKEVILICIQEEWWANGDPHCSQMPTVPPINVPFVTGSLGGRENGTPYLRNSETPRSESNVRTAVSVATERDPPLEKVQSLRFKW